MRAFNDMQDGGRTNVKRCGTRAAGGKLGICLSALLALALAGSACAAPADKKANREREMLRKMQASQQQLSDEKAQLEKDMADLGKKVATLSGQSGSLRAALGRAETKAAEVQKELEASRRESAALGEKLQDSQKKFDELVGQHKEKLQTLAARDNELAQVRSDLEAQGRNLDASESRNTSCEEKNLTLYRLNVELAERYRNKGFFDAVGQVEPFTQLKNVEIENILQEYRDKFDAERIEPTHR